jgi:UDP-N-acetylmuramoylalanine--D-glutamate ligase
VFQDIKNDDYQKKVILFSPSAASFDSFKNFEERGKYFNKLITKYL